MYLTCVRIFSLFRSHILPEIDIILSEKIKYQSVILSQQIKNQSVILSEKVNIIVGNLVTSKHHHQSSCHKQSLSNPVRTNQISLGSPVTTSQISLSFTSITQCTSFTVTKCIQTRVYAPKGSSTHMHIKAHTDINAHTCTCMHNECTLAHTHICTYTLLLNESHVTYTNPYTF